MAANMATTQITNNVIPTTFNGGDDVETFITECRRYFEICSIKGKMQINFVKCLMSRRLESLTKD
jgi:hypothetical protein